MAPEIHLKQGYSGPLVDVFALGVIVFSMLTGKRPFIKAHAGDPFYKDICSNKLDTFWVKHKELKDFFTEDSKDLIQKMICYDPEKRITLKEIMEHPW